MRVHPKHYLGLLAVLAMTMPAWAGRSSSRTDSTRFDTDQTVTIGKLQLQPGHYRFEAKESGKQLEIRKRGDDKVIGSVPCHWIQLSKKPQDSEVFSHRNRVIQVEFQGRTEAVKVG